MTYSIASPRTGHSIGHHSGEAATVWGQTITPSIAHLIQSRCEFPIDYSRANPSTVPETDTGAAMLPHVLDASRLRFHSEAVVFRRTVGQSDATVEATACLDLSHDYTLKLWGRVAPEAPSRRDLTDNSKAAPTIPVIFSLVFWEVSRTSDARVLRFVREAPEKDREIQQLRAQVALAMCSQ